MFIIYDLVEYIYNQIKELVDPEPTPTPPSHAYRKKDESEYLKRKKQEEERRRYILSRELNSYKSQSAIFMKNKYGVTINFEPSGSDIHELGSKRIDFKNVFLVSAGEQYKNLCYEIEQKESELKRIVEAINELEKIKRSMQG
ncbi:hypothetical protein [Hippea sp. KM1]|uniref:hypothetical protein n=1 Tax=Hippea sp. KM1 TaxID=944481 RepID=UPI00046D5AE2|nr:hypothetical protein [Hippea sp. KM1]